MARPNPNPEIHHSLREHPLPLEKEWVERLAALVRGKIHVDIHPAVAPQQKVQNQLLNAEYLFVYKTTLNIMYLNLEHIN